MHADAAGDRHVRLDVAVAAQHRVVGDDDPILDDAVVRDVDVHHQEVVRPEPGDALLLLAAAVDRHPSRMMLRSPISTRVGPPL